MKKRKLEDAARDYEKAVDLYPKYASAWCELGRLQVRQKQIDDGRKSFDSASGRTPSSSSRT